MMHYTQSTQLYNNPNPTSINLSDGQPQIIYSFNNNHNHSHSILRCTPDIICLADAIVSGDNSDMLEFAANFLLYFNVFLVFFFY